MGRKALYLLPKVKMKLQAFGRRIELARKRRKMTITQMSERVGVSRVTYRKIEAGEPAVAFGHYVNALRVLQMIDEIDLLAKVDDLGRELQDAEL